MGSIVGSAYHTSKNEEEIGETLRILIVDDNESLCRSLQLILKKEGYYPVTALTGKEALVKAKELRFDIAFVDIRLPDMNGTDLLSDLVKINPDIDCIIITGFASIETAVSALEQEASAYLTKPLDMDRLLRLIEQIVEKKKLVNEKEDALRALRESEQRNRIIVDAMSDLVLVYDSEDHLTEYFAADDSLLYKSWDEIRGLKIEEYMPQDIATRHYDSIEMVRKSGKSETYDYELDLGGKSRWFRATPMLHDDGKSIVIAIKEISEQKKTEEALIESEKWFRSIFRESPIAINVFDPRGNLVEANQAMLEFTGTSQVEELSELNLLDDPNLPFEMKERILRGDNVIYEHEFDFDLVRNKGIYQTSKTGIAYILSGITPLRNSTDGKIQGYIVQIIDETTKVKAEKRIVEERDRAQDYLDIAGAPIVIINTDGDVVLINIKGSEILGYSIDEIVGRNWFENFIPHHRRTEVHGFFSNLMKGEIEGNELVEYLILTGTGQERFIEWRNSLVHDNDGNIIGIMSSGVDITDRRIAEDNLQRAADTAMLYLDIMGHDLRNHLQAIVMATDIIGHYELGAEIKPVFDLIVDSVGNSQKLINQVQATRELLSTPLERVSLIEVFSECVERAKKFHSDAEIEITSEIQAAEVKADRYLSILCSNLVNNAVQHNINRNRHVWITLKATQDGYAVSIKDDGPGISNERKESLFDAERRFGGVGIHQAKSIVQKYGGYISIEDRVPGESNKGASFTIWLPKADGNQNGENATLPFDFQDRS